jgi:predicted nucleotidyltransferase
MKIAGIIAEYNPFHNGHAYHIQETKNQFEATHIVAVMSGNFTQRGDVAIVDKFERTKAALENGVDLVIELPVAYALATAQQFAYGAVYLLNALGCVDILSFGSESGDIELLTEAAGAVQFASQHEATIKNMKFGMTYPLALENTIQRYYQDCIVDVLKTPNNTLAIEYINALSSLGSPIKPVTVKRLKAPHDSIMEEYDEIVSASQLRRKIMNNEDISELTPMKSIIDFADIKNLETAILAKLRGMQLSEIKTAPNIAYGLENRIFKAIRTATDLNELQCLIKTKNFTMARIRRILLCLFLGIKNRDLEKPPSYIRILGMNQKGKEILSAANLALPADTSLTNLRSKSKSALKQAVLEEKCGNLYALAFSKKKICGMEYTKKAVII